MHRLIHLIPISILVPVLLVGTGIGQDSPYAQRLLRPLERIVLDLATVGRTSDADDLREILAELGHSEKSLTKLADRQAKVRVAKRVSAQRLQRIGKSLIRATRPLVSQLEAIEDTERRKQVASILLRIDGKLATAHATLGHVKLDGQWVIPEVHAMSSRKAVVQAAIQQVRRLAPEIKVLPSRHELILLVYGKPGHHLSFRGFEIHTAWPLAKTKRLMSDIIRAVALSKFLIDGGTIELPKRLRHTSILFKGKPRYQKAIEYDRENGNISAEDAERSLDMAAYYRKDGSLVNNRVMENHALGGIFSHVSGVVNSQLFDVSYHPTLIVGHTNWILMALTGAHLPGITYTIEEKARGTSAGKSEDKRDLLFGAGLMGARSWLRHKVMDGTDPAWSRTFVDQVGKIDGVDMLKTTFVAEYLHYLGPLDNLLKDSRHGVGKPKPEVVASLEKAFGMEVADFETRWRRWMRQGNSGDTSLLGRLGGKVQGLSKVERALLSELSRIRKSALVHDFFTDIPEVTLDRELSDNSYRHARYLNKHPAQLAKWPDAHEEYTDREGFTPEGCWAGNHSVIAPGVANAKEALDGWMGTFFHRLPLLDPGLLRVGWGLAETTAVMDSGSMVRVVRTAWEIAWPYDGMHKVPLRFQLELPNPFPGIDQSEWGYPITLQLGPRDEGAAPEIEITLHKGSADGPLVAGRLSSPQSPGNPLLVPSLAWCFIPTKPLAPNTRYHVTATMSGTEEKVLRWEFTTGR